MLRGTEKVTPEFWVAFTFPYSLKQSAIDQKTEQRFSNNWRTAALFDF
jgi:hypothetical protein